MLPNSPYQPIDFGGLFRPTVSAPVSPSGNNCNNTVIYFIGGAVVLGLVVYAIHQNTQYNYILESLDKQSQDNIELRKTIRLQLAAQNSKANEELASPVKSSDASIKA